MTAELITATSLCKIFGISKMTLWRWERQPELGFPTPVRINKIRYWRLTELEAWLDSRRDGPSAQPTETPQRHRVRL